MLKDVFRIAIKFAIGWGLLGLWVGFLFNGGFKAPTNSLSYVWPMFLLRLSSGFFLGLYWIKREGVHLWIILGYILSLPIVYLCLSVGMFFFYLGDGRSSFDGDPLAAAFVFNVVFSLIALV